MAKKNELFLEKRYELTERIDLLATRLNDLGRLYEKEALVDSIGIAEKKRVAACACSSGKRILSSCAVDISEMQMPRKTDLKHKNAINDLDSAIKELEEATSTFFYTHLIKDVPLLCEKIRQAVETLLLV